MGTINNCTAYGDDAFGPVVKSGCRGGFDFTLLFERSILTLLPAVCFLIAFLTRFGQLLRTDVKTIANPLRSSKLLAAASLVALQLAVLILSGQDAPAKISIPVAAASVNVVVALQFVALSWIEDARSVRPSTLLTLYLVFTVLLDLAQARSLWLLHSSSSATAALFSASVATKIILLFLEAQHKRSFLKSDYRQLPPESTSGVISRSFLWWMNSLIRRGLSSLFQITDLYELDDKLKSGGLKAKLQRAWNARRKPERRFELVLALCRALQWPLMQAVLPRLCLIALTFTQPFLISAVINLVSEPGREATSNKGYGLIGATALIYLGMTVFELHYHQIMNRCVTMSRGAMVSLIYERALLVPDGLYNEATAVTLMSSDTDMIAESLVTVHDIWAYTIQVAVGLFLLAQQLGWVCIMPLVVVAVCTFFASRITMQVGAQQKQWVDAVQKRVGITSSVLSDMRSIKMMGLTQLMTETVQKLRVRETTLMSGFRWNIVWKNIIANLALVMAPPVTFAVYGIQAAIRGSSSIDTVQAFASLSIITLLTGPMALLLQTVPATAAGLGSFDRVQAFLAEIPRKDIRKILPSAQFSNSEILGGNRSDPVRLEAGVPAVSLENADLRPAPSADIILRGLSFSVARGSITVIVGPVASGKSTLLKSILGEGICERGTIGVSDKRMAYCGQTPWLPTSTIRKAICGHVNIAETDEPWYQTCLRACALDRDISILPDGDETAIGSGSTTLSGGQRHRLALARAVYTRAKIVVLDNVLSALDSKTKRRVVESLLSERGLFKKLGSTVLLATHTTEYLSIADKIIALSNGRLEYQGSYLEAVRLGVVNEPLPDDSIDNREEDNGERRESLQKLTLHTTRETDRDDLQRKTGDLSLYKYYFSFIGWPKALLFFSFVILNVFGDTFSQIWLKMWSDIGGEQVPLYASVYLILPVVTIIGLGGYIWSFLIVIVPACSNNVHYVLLKTVMRAPQTFFSATDTGSILNRFSQDMTLIESTLAFGTAIAISSLVRCIARVGLIASGSVYLTATIPFVLIVVYCLQFVYLQTSRQLRLLDLEAKSPLYSHFLTTLEGLSTIRSFNWQHDNQAENNRLLDLSQRPHYLLLSCQKWLSLVLGLIVSAEAVLVVGLVVGLRQFTSPGLLGISLINVLSFSTVLSGVVSGWTDLETSLGSIARTREFERDIKSEDKEGETYKPLPEWPEQGAIEFHDVTASHNSKAPALRNVSFKIKPGQKVGICGRTGSGKSSLLATLLRLLEIDNGKIVIDGLDLATIPRDIIRQRLVTLPQDPLILVGTVRLNADPCSRATDEAIIGVLTEVGIWNILEERGGLDAEITFSSLSKGQQQMFALARAMLHNGKIMLLDEPTSNIDGETDVKIQQLLREKCAGCTVLTIAHRMESIVGSDVVIVLDGGKVAEFGSPKELLRTNGEFAQLVRG